MKVKVDNGNFFEGGKYMKFKVLSFLLLFLFIQNLMGNQDGSAKFRIIEVKTENFPFISIFFSTSIKDEGSFIGLNEKNFIIEKFPPVKADILWDNSEPISLGKLFLEAGENNENILKIIPYNSFKDKVSQNILIVLDLYKNKDENRFVLKRKIENAKDFMEDLINIQSNFSGNTKFSLKLLYDLRGDEEIKWYDQFEEWEKYIKYQIENLNEEKIGEIENFNILLENLCKNLFREKEKEPTGILFISLDDDFLNYFFPSSLSIPEKYWIKFYWLAFDLKEKELRKKGFNLKKLNEKIFISEKRRNFLQDLKKLYEKIDIDISEGYYKLDFFDADWNPERSSRNIRLTFSSPENLTYLQKEINYEIEKSILEEKNNLLIERASKIIVSLNKAEDVGPVINRLILTHNYKMLHSVLLEVQELILKLDKIGMNQEAYNLSNILINRAVEKSEFLESELVRVKYLFSRGFYNEALNFWKEIRIFKNLEEKNSQLNEIFLNQMKNLPLKEDSDFQNFEEWIKVGYNTMSIDSKNLKEVLYEKFSEFYKKVDYNSCLRIAKISKEYQLIEENIRQLSSKINFELARESFESGKLESAFDYANDSIEWVQTFEAYKIMAKAALGMNNFEEALRALNWIQKNIKLDQKTREWVNEAFLISTMGTLNFKEAVKLSAQYFRTIPAGDERWQEVVLIGRGEGLSIAAKSLSYLWKISDRATDLKDTFNNLKKIFCIDYAYLIDDYGEILSGTNEANLGLDYFSIEKSSYKRYWLGDSSPSFQIVKEMGKIKGIFWIPFLKNGKKYFVSLKANSELSPLEREYFRSLSEQIGSGEAWDKFKEPSVNQIFEFMVKAVGDVLSKVCEDLKCAIQKTEELKNIFPAEVFQYLIISGRDRPKGEIKPLKADYSLPKEILFDKKANETPLYLKEQRKIFNTDITEYSIAIYNGSQWLGVIRIGLKL
ncbi:MAG: hypothetical protein ABIM62_07840 [candidate division WOR-3 bacterium]